jgi:ribosome-associated heat shock protein Hsp15
MSGEARQRIDKWLWFARLAKTRTIAQKLAISGRVRVNREKNASASRPVKVGDVLTIAFDASVRVLKIAATGNRRGPAAEARLLYEDLSPPPPETDRAARAGERLPGSGRPTKRERRALDAFQAGDAPSGEDFSPDDE